MYRMRQTSSWKELVDTARKSKGKKIGLSSDETVGNLLKQMNVIGPRGDPLWPRILKSSLDKEKRRIENRRRIFQACKRIVTPPDHGLQAFPGPVDVSSGLEWNDPKRLEWAANIVFSTPTWRFLERYALGEEKPNFLIRTGGKSNFWFGSSQQQRERRNLVLYDLSDKYKVPLSRDMSHLDRGGGGVLYAFREWCVQKDKPRTLISELMVPEDGENGLFPDPLFVQSSGDGAGVAAAAGGGAAAAAAAGGGGEAGADGRQNTAIHWLKEALAQVPVASSFEEYATTYGVYVLSKGVECQEQVENILRAGAGAGETIYLSRQSFIIKDPVSVETMQKILELKSVAQVFRK